ncbi:MAG: SHOCT domain-containing protein [Hyphomicrobiaceae bacterium]
MALTDELDKLARLRAQGALTLQEFETAKSRLLSPAMFKGVRKQSAVKFAGWPLWSVAVGPDTAKGEMRGHAKGIFAVGDMATGVFAAGGLARGVVALGGLAVGLVSFGGMSIGLLLALGGGALGAIAFGGGAVGAVAIGGGAAGHYAMGGGAVGTHVLSPAMCDAEALDFFSRAFEWWPQLDILAQNCFS